MGAFGQSLGQSAATGAVNSAVSGLFGALNSAIGARINWKYQKKAMKLQNQYDIEAFNRENERQNWLMQNAAALTKQGLKNAGYSTADPNGVGVTTPQTNTQDVPSGTFAPYSTPNLPDAASSYASLKQGQLTDANARLLNSQAKLNEIEADKRAEKIQADINLARQTVTNMQEKLPEELLVLQATKEKLVSEKQLNDKQQAVYDQQVLQLEQVVKGLTIENEYKATLNKAQIAKMQAEAAKALVERDYQKYVNQLASQGILVNADGLTNLINLCVNHPETGKIVINGFIDMVKQGIAGTPAGSAIQGGADLLTELLVIPLQEWWNKFTAIPNLDNSVRQRLEKLPEGKRMTFYREYNVADREGRKKLIDKLPNLN